MQFDPNDTDIDKRPICPYCTLPINKPFIIADGKTYLGRYCLMMHPECVGPYNNFWKTKELAFFAILVSIFSLILSFGIIFLS